MPGWIGAALALGATACVEEARLATPPSLAGGERIAVAGVGGARAGAFSLGPNAGRFDRDETRLALFEPLYERRRTAAVVSLSGPDFPAGVEARCAGGRQDAGLGALTAPLADFRVDCAVSVPGRLALAASREGLSGALSKEARTGEISLEGRPSRSARSTPTRAARSRAGRPRATRSPKAAGRWARSISRAGTAR